MEVSDLLVSTVRDIRAGIMDASEDGAEPSIAVLAKEVNKHPDFEGQKINQGQVSESCPLAPLPDEMQP